MKHRFLLLALCACALLACDSANPVAPSGSVLSVNANPTQISLSGGSSRITVSGFKPDGNPLNPGTQILLSTDLGNIYDAATGGNPVSTIEATGNGQAIAYLRGDGRAGPATVTATLATSAEATATAAVQIGLPAADQPTLLLTASPSVINLNGASTISALARNSDGSALGAGQQIRLRTSLGSLDDETLTTDANGEAQTTLRPGTITGTATVTGTVGSSAEATVSVTFGESTENKPTLSLTANPGAISPGDTSVITAQARAADGSPLGNATVIMRTSLGTLDKTSATTASNGQVQFTLTAGDQSGDAVVTGSVGSSIEVEVTVSIGRPALLINANPSTIDVGETSIITVTARGSNGTPLAGREVLLTADFGTLDDDSPLTDDTGRATAIFTAGTQASTMGGVSAILGSSDQVSVPITIRDVPATVALTVAPSEFTPVPAPGTDFTLTVTVTNAQNIPLNNEIVTFDLDPNDVAFTLTPAGGITTNSSGVATATMNITDQGVPVGTSQILVRAIVRGVESDPIPIVVVGGGGP